MRILEIDALVADFGHRRRGLGRDVQPAQSVRHEQDEIMGVLFCANAVPADSKTRPADSNTIERRIEISPERRIFGMSAVASV